LGKKEGRIQTNIGGKRVDFTGRNVICGAGSMLRVNEFGIPPHVYKILTKPERVSSRNIDYCQELVNTNQANFVRRGKNVINLKVVTKNFTVPYKIYPGDVVERHLKDGDIVLVNRQPTLRKESIQAFYVKRITGNRDPFGPFRLPLPVTCGFNADFDGSTL
jgi:DNA-directed RNA polymerase beta' subunit